MYQIKKKFAGYPFAHRQPNHSGHCKLIHGHNWDFEICLESQTLDENGFVYDFGKFKWLKEWLEDMFDHTLLLNQDDPELRYLTRVLRNQLDDEMIAGKVPEVTQFAKIHIVPCCSSEGLAKYVYDYIENHFETPPQTELGIKVVSVTVYEDDKNQATYFGGN